jgi:hypothetical protein
MPTSTKKVDYYGITLDCEYDWDHYTPQTYDHPAEGGFECITRVYHNGEDIMDLLAESIINELELKIQKDER